MKKILLSVIFVLMSVSVLFAGSKTKAQWLFGLPVDNRIYVGADNYIVDNADNYRIDISTNLNISGNIVVTKTPVFSQFISTNSTIAKTAAQGSVIFVTSDTYKVMVQTSTVAGSGWQSVGGQ